MPLVLFSGYPSSGKTTVAKELISLLTEKLQQDESLSKKNYSIVYHSDQSLGIKHSDYISSKDERKLRSEIISAVKRDLSKNNIVIVDSLNYIKGFRYQLHCEVKNVATTFCLIHTMCPVDIISEWNQAADHSAWDTELLNQLIQRYEEPNGQTRWDSPLFPILTSQDSIKEHFDDICTAIFRTNDSRNNRDPLSKSLQKPNSATILKPASQTNFIQILDSETTLVVKKIMSHIKMLQSIGGSPSSTRVIVSEGITDINDDNCCYIDLPASAVTLPLLQRLKRQFVNLNKLRDMEKARIVPLFTDYLNKNLND